MTGMKLFYVPGVCSLSPHIVLREMGADFKLDKVDRNTKVSESGANYNQLNPKSYVPALQLDDGTLLTEGAAIIMYLADQKGGDKVAPKAGTKERYKLQEWLVFIATELHKNFGAIFPRAPTRFRAKPCRSGWISYPRCWRSSPSCWATNSAPPTRTSSRF